MSESKSQNNYPIVPPSELRCVWMAAGVLSYQLCDRKLDCDGCPLDIALRQRLVDQPELRARKKTVVPAMKGESQNEDLLYGEKHLWVRRGEENSARVGIEPGFAALLLSLKAVVLPSIGEQVVKGKVCAWIVLDGGTLPLVAPVSGKIKSTNSRLGENPHAVCSSPLSHGWLFEVSLENRALEGEQLLTASAAAGVYLEDHRRFQALISAEMAKGTSHVGETLPDGGQLVTDLSEYLGPAKYFKSLQAVYGSR